MRLELREGQISDELGICRSRSRRSAKSGKSSGLACVLRCSALPSFGSRVTKPNSLTVLVIAKSLDLECYDDEVGQTERSSYAPTALLMSRGWLLQFFEVR